MSFTHNISFNILCFIFSIVIIFILYVAFSFIWVYLIYKVFLKIRFLSVAKIDLYKTALKYVRCCKTKNYVLAMYFEEISVILYPFHGYIKPYFL